MISNSDVVVQRKRPLAGLHVLVVDDNEDTRDVLQAVLELDGATVSTARSSDAALTALDAERPDVMLIDIGIPIMNGSNWFGRFDVGRSTPEAKCRRLL